MRRRGAAACGARDGRACRSYSWPRAPPSMVVFSGFAARRQRLAQVGRAAVSSAPGEGALRDGLRRCRPRRGRHTRRGRRAGRSGRPRRWPSGVRTTRSSSRFGPDRATGDAGSARDVGAVPRYAAARLRRHLLGDGRLLRGALGLAGAAALAFATGAPARPRPRPSRRPSSSRAWASAGRLGRLAPGPWPAASAAAASAAAAAAGFGGGLLGDPLRLGGRCGRRRGGRRASPASVAAVRPGRRRRRCVRGDSGGLGSAPSPRRPTRRSGCRCASRSGARPGGRSGPRGRWPARASAPGRSRSRCGAPRRCRPR